MIGYENSNVPGLFIELEKRGIAAKEIAAITGSCQGNITDWKTGKSSPSKQKRKIICEYLGITEEYLYSGNISDLQSGNAVIENVDKEKASLPVKDSDADNSDYSKMRNYIMSLYDRLSPSDRDKVQDYVEGLILRRPPKRK